MERVIERRRISEKLARSILSRPPGGRTEFVWDEEVRGFGIRVSAGGVAAFVVQGRVRGGRLVRATVGRCDRWTVEAARRRAREILVEMDRGVDPVRAARAARARGVTLEDAVAAHAAAMQARGCSSVGGLREEIARHLGDWLARPLVSITRDECARRHERVTRGHGPYAANRVFRLLRAAWNTADRRLDDLPKSPVRGVTFNKERRRREPIPWGDLPAWRARVEALRSAVLRDLHLFVLLTGLRVDAEAARVRWEHVDLEAGTVHVPRPKGGVDRAFTVPVSAAALELLRRRREENEVLWPGSPWAFPGRGGAEPLTKVRPRGLPTPHRLRDTFVAASRESGVGRFEEKVLMNHRLPGGDVTDGYYRPSMEHLRAAAEKIAALLLARMVPAPAPSGEGNGSGPASRAEGGST